MNKLKKLGNWLSKNNFKLAADAIAKIAAETLDGPITMELPMEIPDSLYRLSDIMRRARYEVHIAGGAVRDTILGKIPKDYDIATNASPKDVIRILERELPLVRRAEIQGEKSFAVARIITNDGNEYEFAPYRVESGTRMGGDAIISTKDNPLSIKDDVMRRDLTINALFYKIPTHAEREEGIVGEVVDYVGGISDIENEIVRTVGDPRERFKEDRLRILRAFRFAGRMGGEIDKETADAILENNSLTEDSDAAVSAERITEELAKGIKTSKSSAHYINMLLEFDLFGQILPGLSASRAFSQSKDIAVQFATILLGNDKNSIKRVLHSKKFSNNIISSVLFLIDLNKLDKENVVDLKSSFSKMLSTSKSTMSEKAVIEFGGAIGKDFNKFLKFAQAPFAITARELIESGMRPGPDIGMAIREAEVAAYFGNEPGEEVEEESSE
jgi:tRNA nucleotidyltransferase/poly(A) polymerase